MKNYTNLKIAKDTNVYVIVDNTVVEANLHEHIMDSAEETTTPHGVDYVNYIAEVEEHIYININHKEYINEDEYNLLDKEERLDYEYFGEIVNIWELRSWIGRGSKSMLSMSYDNKEDAEQALFECHINDFDRDDQRDTSYYYSYEEANNELISISEL